MPNRPRHQLEAAWRLGVESLARLPGTDFDPARQKPKSVNHFSK